MRLSGDKTIIMGILSDDTESVLLKRAMVRYVPKLLNYSAGLVEFGLHD